MQPGSERSIPGRHGSPGHVAGGSKPHAPGPTVDLELCDADVRHRDFLEQVWGSDDRGRVIRQFCSELRMPERSPVVSGRFPDGIVEIRRAVAESPMKLCGDKARLALHERSVVLPGLEKGLLVRFVERNHIYQHDGSGLDCDLAFDREGGVKRA
jgi:hypothetical protein